MTPSAGFERRIQAGASYLSLLVRSGESCWQELADHLAGFHADRFVIATDGAAPAAYLAHVRTLATAQAPTTVQDWRQPTGPTDGRTVVIALGGEQVGGIAAQVRLPTTLAAACGPALSMRRPAPGHPEPVLVWVRSDLLADRPAPETRAGMVTVIRHVLAVCPALYDSVANALRPDARYSDRALCAFLAVCADARATLVCFDPYETGPALALRYGRSLGDAVRRVCGGGDTPDGLALAPGDADGLGLLLAARIAVRLGLLDSADARAHCELLARNGSATALPAEWDTALVDALHTAAEPGLLLLGGLGRPRCADGRLLTPVADPVLRAAAADGPARASVARSTFPAPRSVPVSVPVTV
ncbi:hypothetical protein ACIGZJ_05515 [Kitasatospora sp. NPDC052868]|uniref:3-dehydroquinate synthase family protein n=1 Tax=Kitasatospora sp. NPDC052868 TaxID=3364060 RepID=UPI0037C5F127